jgi:hypothetical protein
MDALQLMSQWSSYMESGANGGSGINLASTPSRKLSRFVRQTSGMGLGLGSPSRKKSSAGNGGGNNNSLAAALAQAMAYANSNSSGTPKAGSSSAVGGEAGYGQLGAPYSYSRSATAPGGNGNLASSNISASMKNQSPFSSKQQAYGGVNGNLSHSWEEGDDEHDDASFQDFMPTMAMARKNSQASLNRDTSLKLLNKAKISYREVMEG